MVAHFVRSIAQDGHADGIGNAVRQKPDSRQLSQLETMKANVEPPGIHMCVLGSALRCSGCAASAKCRNRAWHRAHAGQCWIAVATRARLQGRHGDACEAGTGDRRAPLAPATRGRSQGA